MKTTRFQLMAAACFGMLISPVAMGETSGQRADVVDVALADGGVLMGRVINSQGASVVGAPVSVQLGDREIMRVATVETGEFAARGLIGGVYLVDAAGRRAVYRLWAPGTAPPAANQGILAVSDGEVVRAQFAPPMTSGYGSYSSGGTGAFRSGLNWIQRNPFITAGAVAAAIAIPIAVSQHNDGPAS